MTATATTADSADQTKDLAKDRPAASPPPVPAKTGPNVTAIVRRILWTILPALGVALAIGFWALLSATIAKDLPSPLKTWEVSRPRIMTPFAYKGEMDQGILRFTWLSLVLVAQGYLLALVLGTPLGFCLGLSKTFTRLFDPIIQILRPVSPLAWLPLGMILFINARGIPVQWFGRTEKWFATSDLAALFTIAVCAMWPTVLNTAVGVRAIPQDYLNVAKVLKLNKWDTLWKILVPATLPYMFTGYRLSLGIAWLVIVAAEMLTGRPGVGGFLWQQYNGNVYEEIILCILTIGLVGYILDRLMSVIESRFKSI